MGLFSLFSKKHVQSKTRVHPEPKVTVTFQAPICARAEHESWKKKNGNSDNDYANAVFLSLHKQKAHMMNHTAHLGYLSYKLGIDDPIRKYKDMLHEGYFRVATASEILSTFKVVELKEILENYGFDTKGKKTDLITAITENIPIKKLKLQELYCLSSKGWDFINQHQDLITLFRNPYKITYDEYMSAKNSFSYNLSYDDIVWTVFTRRELTFSATDNLSRRFNAFYRAEFLKNEGKYKTALLEYLTVAYYDIEETLNTFDHVPLSQWHKDELTPPETELHSHLVDTIFELREHYQADFPSAAIQRSNVTKKHLLAKQYTNYIETLLASKESDFMEFVRK